MTVLPGIQPMTLGTNLYPSLHLPSTTPMVLCPKWANCLFADGGIKAHSHERLNCHDSIAEGTPAMPSLVRIHSCWSRWLKLQSCNEQQFTLNMFKIWQPVTWKCSKFSNQSLVAVTRSLVWTSCCWNMARFHRFATCHKEINALDGWWRDDVWILGHHQP